MVEFLSDGLIFSWLALAVSVDQHCELLEETRGYKESIQELDLDG